MLRSAHRARTQSMTVSPPRAQVVSPPRAHFQVDNFAVILSMKRCAMMTLERMVPPARLSSSIQVDKISPVRTYCNVTVGQHPSIKTGRFIWSNFHLFTALLTILRPCNKSVSTLLLSTSNSRCSCTPGTAPIESAGFCQQLYHRTAFPGYCGH